MRHPTTAAILSALLGTAICATATRETISATQDGIEFDIDRYYDGRPKPFRVVFYDENNGRHIYYFNDAGVLKTIKPGDEKYNVSGSAPTSHVQSKSMRHYCYYCYCQRRNSGDVCSTCLLLRGTHICQIRYVYLVYVLVRIFFL